MEVNGAGWTWVHGLVIPIFSLDIILFDNNGLTTFQSFFTVANVSLV